MSQENAKIAVVLSGCGVYDGTEIHESVLTLLALNRQGATYQCFAPDIDQAHVINHISGEETGESRNVLIESARIARGAIQPLSDYKAADFDGIIFPGGFGAAKNLCTIAFDGPECTVNEDVTAAVKGTASAKKPIGALCIAPAMMAKILEGANVTIGQDDGTAGAIEAMGGTHTKTMQAETVIDANYRLVTSPCYMLDSSIGQIADGAENTVKILLDIVKEDKAAA